MFPGASRLWELAYLLGLTWVASYVFFYINVHLKAVREKETLRPFLYTYTRQTSPLIARRMRAAKLAVKRDAVA